MVGQGSSLWVIVVICALHGCSSTRSAIEPAEPRLFARSGSANPAAAEWNQWADQNLQDGDILFMRGDCYMLLGAVNFSDLSSDLADSRFSHIGLVAIEDGQAYVYDVRSQGCLRTRFGTLLTDRLLHQVAIKRYRELSADNQQAITDFCRQVYRRKERYDDQLKLDNGRLYCTELVESAYRTAGFTLSEPVAIHDLPNYERHLKSIQLVRAMTRIEPDQLVLVPGNDQIGVWSNSMLDLVLDLPDTKVRPVSVVHGP